MKQNVQKVWFKWDDKFMKGKSRLPLKKNNVKNQKGQGHKPNISQFDTQFGSCLDLEWETGRAMRNGASWGLAHSLKFKHRGY